MAPLGLGMGIIWDEFPGGVPLDAFKGTFGSTQSGIAGFTVTPGWSGVTKANGDVIRITYDIYLEGTWAETLFSDSINISTLVDGEATSGTPVFANGAGGFPSVDKSVTSDGNYGNTFNIISSSGDEPSAGSSMYFRNMVVTITSSGGSTGDKFNKTFDFTAAGGSDLALFADFSGNEGSTTRSVGNAYPG